jgi:dipeptidyl-peptidase-4
MMRIWLLLIFVAFSLGATAQKKSVELADFVAKGTFVAKGIEQLRPMKDGAHYTVLEEGGQKVVKYAYASKKPVAVLVNVPELKKTTIESIQDYEFSSDETKMLVYTNRQNIYRRSFMADYYVVDIARKEIEPLSANGSQQAAAFAPNGYSVAYVRDNDLHIKNLRFQTEAAITNDGARDTVINGVPDWVYEEEFAFNRAFEWSPNSEEIAYIKFDERSVKPYQFPLYQASHPTTDSHELYPGTYRYKYPKAGEKNARVSVHVFNVQNRTTKKMDVPGDDIYIPRIMWTTNPDQLAIVTLNRRQDQLNLYLTNSSSGVARSILTDRNSRYISTDVLDQIVFLEDGKHFVYVAELDGYYHIHLYGMDGIKVNQVTKGNWDVTEYYGFDARNKQFYFQAAAVSPLQREVYSIRMDGSRLARITPQDGTNTAWFSSDFSFYISEYSSKVKPSVYTVFNKAGRQQYVLEDNKALEDLVKGYALPDKEFFTFKTEMGDELNGYIIKPLQMDAAKSYPLLMTQYSGPNSQQVLDKWDMDWEYYLASQGYVVACVDGRGTGARGEDFRKQTYMQLGKLESDDQVAAARYLGALDYVDAERIGIWGWSYGGFMSSLVMSRSDLFKTGIAIAPITDWKFYDTAFTERFMRMPRENPSGYDQFAPLSLADDLHGRLFLIHGTADDNVHVQNAMEYTDRLVQAGKQFDMFIYPNRAHSIIGGNARMHLYQMKFDFLERHLK